MIKDSFSPKWYWLHSKISLSLIILCSCYALSSCNEQMQPNIIVIFTDDQGYADVGAYGMTSDIKTPHIDQLAADGVRMTAGYVTAPQCAPSRAGILSGQYQQKIGLEENEDCPMDSSVVTIAERMKALGYKTGIVGKWQLEPHFNSTEWVDKNYPQVRKLEKKLIPFQLTKPYSPMAQGFDDVWWGSMISYRTNYNLKGETLEEVQRIVDKRFRVDVQTDAALTFIDRHHEQPFFLYLSYFSPHFPIEASDKYLSRFDENMPKRRRYALATMAAMDDGVGLIRSKLEEFGLTRKTLIFYISDNGALLDLTKKDKPLTDKKAQWNGSINDPWEGEKGILMEGGIRVPFIVSWPGKLPNGKVYEKPVSALDVAATSLAVAGGEKEPSLDGVNLVPFLEKDNAQNPHEYLYWRFAEQAAIRHENWKYLYLSDGREYLFDVESEAHENQNLIQQNPEMAAALKNTLIDWTNECEEKGLPQGPITAHRKVWYDYFLRKEIKPKNRN